MQAMTKIAATAIALLAALTLGASAAPATVAGTDVLYTLDADFARGTLASVNHAAPNGNQLQLSASSGTFRFMWLTRQPTSPLDPYACNLVKIDTDTGAVLGEYRTMSQLTFTDPSAYDCNHWDEDGGLWWWGHGSTAMAHNGSVWTTRHLAGITWSGGWTVLNDVTHVGLKELGQCVDRNGNGRIDTSTGLGDVRDWTGTRSEVANAADECILHHLDLRTYGLFELAWITVDAANKLWVPGAWGSPEWVRLDATTGVFEAFGDDGLPAGTVPYEPPRGTVVEANGDVWIGAEETDTPGFRHEKSDGRFVGFVRTPGGYSLLNIARLDAAGKPWIYYIADEYPGHMGYAVRIDPALGPLGCGGTGCGDGTHVGAADLTLGIPSGLPRLTDWPGGPAGRQSIPVGSTAPDGTWTVIQDGTATGRSWGTISWNTEPQGDVPAGTGLTVEARAADNEADLGGQAYAAVTNGGGFSRTGRFIQVRVTLQSSAEGQSAVLSDLRIQTAANAPPDAVDDALTTSQGTPGTVNVLANDTDPDGDPLTVTSKTNGANGTVSCAAAGSCTYTPAAGYGPDSFTYTISDGQGGNDTATVSVTVTPVNQAPIAVGDSLTTSQGTPGTVNVLANDTDSNGDPLTVTATTNGAHGTVSCAPAGSCTYTPAAGYNGSDSFTYTVSDGRGGTDAASVSVTVLAPPPPPPPPPPPAGRVSGNGDIGGTSLFKISFTVDATATGGAFGFDAKKAAFRATTIAHFTKTGINQVTFDGAATWNGAAGYSYQVSFVDNGTPGKKDTMSVVVRTPAGAVVFTTEGPKNLVAASGNVVVN